MAGPSIGLGLAINRLPLNSFQSSGLLSSALTAKDGSLLTSKSGSILTKKVS